VRALAYGSSSFIKSGEQTSPAINPGTGAMNGLMIGNRANLDPTYYTKIDWYGLIIRKIQDTTTSESEITAYLNTKYGL
jgi:hypothetical protein